MTIFIEGTAFVIGKLNLNNQGIPFSEVDNAIKSLKTSVVRICSRVDPHFCDNAGDPLSEIGHVADAWREEDNAVAKASITDTIACQKIEDGTWKPYWSIFGTVMEYDSGGWAHGITIESISLVDNPAWPEAQYSVISASNDDPKKFHIISPFKIISASREGDHIPDETTIDELKAQLEEKEKLINELTPKAESVTALETQVADLTASNADLETKLKEKETLIASMEKREAVSMPMDEVMKKVAAAIAEHDEQQAILKANAEAREAFVAARKALGMETKADQFTALTASEFKEMTETLAVKLSASEKPIYPADRGEGGPKIQVFDPVTRTYTEA